MRSPQLGHARVVLGPPTRRQTRDSGSPVLGFRTHPAAVGARDGHCDTASARWEYGGCTIWRDQSPSGVPRSRVLPYEVLLNSGVDRLQFDAAYSPDRLVGID